VFSPPAASPGSEALVQESSFSFNGSVMNVPPAAQSSGAAHIWWEALVSGKDKGND